MSLGLSLFQSIFVLQPLKVGKDEKTLTVLKLIFIKSQFNLAFSLKSEVFQYITLGI